MQEKAAVSLIATRLAVTMSVVLALSLPAGYFFISYQYMIGSLEAESQINSRLVSQIIGANPLLWRFEQVRLEELLSRRPSGGIAESRRILDDKGGIVAESAETVPFPLVTRSFELLDAGSPVGKIEISRSLRPLLQRTALAGLFGLCCGFLVFRLIPYREVIAAQKKLEDANGFLKTVMESSTNAIIVLDLAGGIRMANRRALEILGYAEQELPMLAFTKLFEPNAARAVSDALAKLSDAETQSVRFETELLHRDGEGVAISCGAAPFSQQGELAGIVVSAEEITARKRWEQQIKSFAAELEESNAELRSFAYIISHDLRAPLVNIKGFAAELNGSVLALYSTFQSQCCALPEGERARLVGLFEQEIPEALDFINSSVQRMDRLINAVLKLSRIGHRELKPEPVQLQDMVEGILKSLSHQIEARSASVSVGELPELHADRMALEQILGNLLDNAVKYLDSGRPGSLEITGENDAGAAVIRIRDNGRGIAAEDLSKVFEIFRRAGRQDVEGEGMGLAYVRTLVRKLHGQIWCESEPGKGSTFSFSIPNEERPSPPWGGEIAENHECQGFGGGYE
jgi:PAS domain S-box-containing protein